MVRPIIVVGIFCCAWLSSTVTAQKTGSVAMAVWSQDEVAVAADSRVSRSQSYLDSSCKVATFDNKLVFVATGRSSPGADPSWDAYAVGSKEFKKISSKGATDHIALKLADVWGEDARVEFQRLGSKGVGGLDNDLILTGLFTDFEKDGTLLIAMSEVSFEIIQTKRIKVIAHTKLIPTSKSDSDSVFLGHSEIVNAVNNPQAPEEMKWRTEFVPTALRWSGEHADDVMGKAAAYVELTIEHLPKTKKDAKGVPFSVVGFPVAAVRLIRGKNVDWIARGRCTDQIGPPAR